ncbi:MAG: sigma-70 family RNA polymerase sigma factor [Bacteroidetes bacterium]|nr:sigma-70 family RNA polymerase sigma factor [Bacteroidota bacterium]
MSTGYSDIHKDLVLLSRDGDSKAQYRLYRLYSRAMFNIACRMMNNREEAEDMLQEAFSDAFTRLGTFRFESSFGAWLKQITVNKCINELKRRKADLVLMDNIGSLNDDEEDSGFDLAGDEDTDETAVRLEVNRVHKAIGQLPDGYRVIFSLYLLEGYDHTEIAEILNISEGTSKSQYMRAKRKLLEILNAEKNENERQT